MKKLSLAISVIFLLLGPLFSEASVDLLNEQNNDFSFAPIGFDVPEGYELADLMEDEDDDSFPPLMRAAGAYKVEDKEESLPLGNRKMGQQLR